MTYRLTYLYRQTTEWEITWEKGIEDFKRLEDALRQLHWMIDNRDRYRGMRLEEIR